MLSSPHGNVVIKILSQNEVVITIYWNYIIWPQWLEWTCHFATKNDRRPEWRSDRIVDRLYYGFDWERIQAENNRP